MRIIGGALKGRTLKVPAHFRGRPTTDFAREGLFNMLGAMLEWDELNVLELFAGTGAFSIECLSRGAQHVDAVEKEALHVKCIADNFRMFEFRNASVFRDDALRWLSNCNHSYHLVFADPPHDMADLKELPCRILNSAAMEKGGLLVFEHNHRDDFTGHEFLLKARRFSNVTFSFFSKK
ncbi:MAG: RsmD family RNA methyltransferase [Flavobacteriales bacterium]